MLSQQHYLSKAKEQLNKIRATHRSLKLLCIRVSRRMCKYGRKIEIMTKIIPIAMKSAPTLINATLPLKNVIKLLTLIFEALQGPSATYICCSCSLYDHVDS